MGRMWPPTAARMSAGPTCFRHRRLPRATVLQLLRPAPLEPHPDRDGALTPGHLHLTAHSTRQALSSVRPAAGPLRARRMENPGGYSAAIVLASEGLPMRRSTALSIAVSLLVATPATVTAQGDTTAHLVLPLDTVVPAPVLPALRTTVAQRYVTPVSTDSLAHFKSAEALLEALGDRHTVLFSPRAFEDFQVTAGQHFGGIGARLAERRDTVYLASVLPDGPAAKAGL